MTREDIRKHFPEATDDQISALLDINSRDVGKVKTAAETASNELKTAKETIAELEKNAKNADDLQKVIDQYKQEQEKREADAKAAEERAERFGRFEKAHSEVGKDAKWLNDFTRDGIFSKFEAALADAGNKGKSDVQIYESLVKDDKGLRPGLFEAKATASGTQPGMGGNAGGAANYAEKKYENNPFVQKFLMG